MARIKHTNKKQEITSGDEDVDTSRPLGTLNGAKQWHAAVENAMMIP